MAEYSIFRGFGQYTRDEYENLLPSQKLGKMLFVRDIDPVTSAVTHAEIYFGLKKYAELNESGATDERINNIIEAFGQMVDPKTGKIQPFGIEHEIIGSATSVYDALTELEDAILEEVEYRRDTLEPRIDDLEIAVSGLTSRVEIIEETHQVTGNDVETI